MSESERETQRDRDRDRDRERERERETERERERERGVEARQPERYAKVCQQRQNQLIENFGVDGVGAEQRA